MATKKMFDEQGKEIKRLYCTEYYVGFKQNVPASRGYCNTPLSARVSAYMNLRAGFFDWALVINRVTGLVEFTLYYRALGLTEMRGDASPFTKRGRKS